MQSIKLIKSRTKNSEVPNETPNKSGAAMPDQKFFKVLFQYAGGFTNANYGFSTQFVNNAGAICSILNCDTFTEVEKSRPLVVMLLQKSILAGKGYAIHMKGKVLIQSEFDVEYTCG